jgi:hypothetical protein
VLDTAVGIDAGGRTHRLSLDTIARSRDPLIAESLVSGAIQRGAAGALCRDIATRVSDDIVEVRVVQERHDLERYAAGHPSLVRRRVHATCAAPG